MTTLLTIPTFPRTRNNNWQNNKTSHSQSLVKINQQTNLKQKISSKCSNKNLSKWTNSQSSNCRMTLLSPNLLKKSHNLSSCLKNKKNRWRTIVSYVSRSLTFIHSGNIAAHVGVVVVQTVLLKLALKARQHSG